jgi:hypothetical protein
MNRREALRRLRAVTGGLVMSPVLPVRALFADDPAFQKERALRTIEGLKGEPHIQAEVRNERGGPRLYLDGTEIYPFLALSRKLIPTTPVFQDAGIDLLQPFLGMQAGWTGPNEYDWSLLDAFLGRLLELNPDARFLPRIHLATPEWWKKAHPEAMIEYGRPYPAERYDIDKRHSEGGHRWGAGNELWEASFASEQWRRDTANMLRAYVRHIENSPLSSRVFGYHFSTGLTGEWHYYGPTFLPDYSAPMTERCSRVPAPDARLRTSAGLLRDPATEGNVIEYYRCQHEATADAVLDMARALKEASTRKVIVGTFYNYLLEVVRIQGIGHLAPKRVLTSPDIEFIACPYTYQSTNMEENRDWESGVVDGAGNWLGRARGVAGDGGPRVPVESLRRHGTLYMSEIDPSTYLADEPLGVGGSGSTTQEGTLQILRRDFGQVFADGIGGWLYDFGTGEAHSDAYGSGEQAERGWFADEPIVAEIRRFVDLGAQRSALHIGSVSPVAALYDAKSFFTTQHWMAAKPWTDYAISVSDFINHWFLNAQARSLHRIGAPVDLMYRFDLADEDLEQYRLLFVANAFFLTADEVSALRALLRDSGVTVVWVYAPGFVTPDGLRLDQMERLTGLRHERLDAPGPMMIRTQMQDGAMPDRFGVNEPHQPRFAVVDPEAEPLGVWADRDDVAFARTEQDGWTSVYVGTAPLPVQVLRWLAREAGVPLWSSKPDVIYGTEDAAIVVATEKGRRRLDFHKHMAPVAGGPPQQTHRPTMHFGEVRLFTAPTQ